MIRHGKPGHCEAEDEGGAVQGEKNAKLNARAPTELTKKGVPSQVKGRVKRKRRDNKEAGYTR